MTKNSTLALMGGVRRNDAVALPSRIEHKTLIGGMDLDFSQAEFPAELTITKVSVVGGVSLVVPPHVRVEVEGFTLFGGKNVERRPDLPAGAPVVRVIAFGLVGGVKVRVAQSAAGNNA